MREGRKNSQKYLRMGRNRTEGREHKDIKKVVKANSRSGCLKKGRGEGWNLLTNYEETISVFRQKQVQARCLTDFRLLGIVVENDLLQLLYLPIKTFPTTILKFNHHQVS